MKEELGFKYTCDVCDKVMPCAEEKLPTGWAYGKFIVLSGYSWEPYVHLCSECWSAPSVTQPRGVFKKLWDKFKWGPK